MDLWASVSISSALVFRFILITFEMGNRRGCVVLFLIYTNTSFDNEIDDEFMSSQHTYHKCPLDLYIV